MQKRIMMLVITFVLVIGLGIFVSQTKAEESKWKLISYITNYLPIPVGDEEGHVLQVYERRGSAIFGDGEIAAILTVASTDRTKDGQTGGGYYQFTFKDGSTIWATFQHTGTLPPGEKFQFIENKGEFTKGAGRFEGIKGSFTCKGPLITLTTPDKTRGDLVLDCIGARVLPQK